MSSLYKRIAYLANDEALTRLSSLVSLLEIWQADPYEDDTPNSTCIRQIRERLTPDDTLSGRISPNLDHLEVRARLAALAGLLERWDADPYGEGPCRRAIRLLHDRLDPHCPTTTHTISHS
jgi:hypothetical protein